jgi:hypothetical protein
VLLKKATAHALLLLLLGSIHMCHTARLLVKDGFGWLDFDLPMEIQQSFASSAMHRQPELFGTCA